MQSAQWAGRPVTYVEAFKRQTASVSQRLPVLEMQVNCRR
jgi:hypothetical protein